MGSKASTSKSPQAEAGAAGPVRTARTSIAISDAPADQVLASALRKSPCDVLACCAALQQGASYQTYLAVKGTSAFARLAGIPGQDGSFRSANELLSALIVAGANASMEVDVSGSMSTPLLQACAAGCLGNVQLLVEHGASPVQVVAGVSGFRAACDCSNDEQAIACVTALAEASGQAAVRRCEASAQQPALYTACRLGRDEFAAALLRCGLAVSSASKVDGNTALHLAAERGNAALLDALVSDADAVDLQDAKACKNKAGRTPLEAARAAGLSEDVMHEVQQLLT